MLLLEYYKILSKFAAKQNEVPMSRQTFAEISNKRTIANPDKYVHFPFHRCGYVCGKSTEMDHRNQQ